MVPYACTHRCGRFYHSAAPAVHVELVTGIVHVRNQAVTTGKGDRLRLHRDDRIRGPGIHADPALDGNTGSGVQTWVIRYFDTVVSVELQRGSGRCARQAENRSRINGRTPVGVGKGNVGHLNARKARKRSGLQCADNRHVA